MHMIAWVVLQQHHRLGTGSSDLTVIMHMILGDSGLLTLWLSSMNSKLN